MPYFKDSKGALYFMSDEDMARKTILVNDPNWVPPTVKAPDPNWVRPTKTELDPNWVRPNKAIPDPNWKAPLISVPDPNWVRPIVEIADANGQLVKVQDMGAEHPMVEVPDPNAVAPMIEVPDESAVPGIIEVPDESAIQPLIDVPDHSAVCPQVEAPNPHFTLPADAVEITDTEAAAIQSPAIPLATLQSNACNQIDAAAGTARAKYITVTAGQSAVYQMKLDEAKAYQAATNPVATDYPHLNAEATQTSTPIADVANLVVNTYTQWVQISAKIEGYRRGGDVAVSNAKDADGVQAALTTALANLESC